MVDNTESLAPPFPFSAIVGISDLKTALLLNLVDPKISGVLVKGHRGSAKTTAVRALAALLQHDQPFVEIPMGATEDRVKGSIDIASVINHSRVEAKAGLLTQAHHGVLYVDEVNLLPDHIVDLILDSAATGLNILERDGVSETLPAEFVLVGSMNPEEGDLRPQLLDRFGLAVSLDQPLTLPQRQEAVRRRLLFEENRSGFLASFAAEESELVSRVASARERIRRTPIFEMVDSQVLELVAELALSSNVQGLRADLTLIRAARAFAALEGDLKVQHRHVEEIAELVLSHRRNASPTKRPQEGTPKPPLRPPSSSRGTRPESPPSDNVPSNGSDPLPASSSSGEPGEQQASPENPATGTASDQGASQEEKSSSPKHRFADELRKRKSLDEGARGVPGGERNTSRDPVNGGAIHLRSTLFAALERERSQDLPTLKEADVRYSVRDLKVDKCVIFLVDTSKSMGAQSRIDLARSAALDLLRSSYVKRLKVALVVFGGESSQVALRPTRSIEVALARFDSVTFSGKTPLALGLSTSRKLSLEVRRRGADPLVVVMTDGRATFADGEMSPLEAAEIEADKMARARIEALVCDFDTAHVSLGFGQRLASLMEASYFRMAE